MTLQVRRVVTGHDAAGRAIVHIDEQAQNVRSTRPGASAAVIWTNTTTPADNVDAQDGAQRAAEPPYANGAIFRVIEYAPGVATRLHRTDTIDYAVVVSGAIDMELDDGVVVNLRAGDVLVQRGTIHNWVNNGTEPCVIAFVLIGAAPVTAGGQTLHATG